MEQGPGREKGNIRVRQRVESKGEWGVLETYDSVPQPE